MLAFELVMAAPLAPGQAWEPTDYYAGAQQEIESFSGEPRFVERPERVSVAQRVVRNAAFRDVVLDAYERRCAVCGEPLSIEDLTELEAAHIVAISEQGPDEPRNGLCLCVRHHWAFDNGVFTLTENLEVESFLEGPDPHGELADGEPVTVPSSRERRPVRAWGLGGGIGLQSSRS